MNIFDQRSNIKVSLNEQHELRILKVTDLRPYFTPRQVEMRGELFEIKRGFKKHFHHIAASQNYHPASPSYSAGEETETEEGSGDGTGYPVDIQFPVSSKVCASFCGQEADVCVEITKMAAV